MATVRSLDLQSATPVFVGAGARTITWLDAFNSSAGSRFVKLYNKATAATVGTDTPFMTIQVPAGAHYLGNFTGYDGVGAICAPLGLTIAATQLVADADATAPAAGDVILNCGVTP
jgi:hypothetical protein